MNNLIDLSNVLGSPYITVTDYVYFNDGYMPVQRDVVNPQYILGFILLLFLTVFLSNIILRTFFRKR